jgi:hypothetical protein
MRKTDYVVHSNDRPLKRFSSLSELLHVMRDAIQGTFNHFPLQNDVTWLIVIGMQDTSIYTTKGYYIAMSAQGIS